MPNPMNPMRHALCTVPPRVRMGNDSHCVKMRKGSTVLAAAALIFAVTASAFAEVKFNRDVRPILSDNCFACHGPDAKQRKAKLRLDEREDALKPSESGDVAIVPGKPEQSALVTRIETTDRDETMPPLKSHKQLTAAQKEMLNRWIVEGARYEAHWAYTQPNRPALPSVRNTSWPRNPIDYFILERLEQQGLAPAPPASPSALVRRVSFGVQGLPPSPEEMTAFTAKPDDAGYTALLEHLLSSEQYGEHWARHWMDLVRYADSAGYELDYLFTHAWQYRDWLTKSFAANKRMDRFIQEQIAGDELWPDAKEAGDGVLFLTIGPMRFEGGIQRSKEVQNAWLTDLADTTGAAFLGLTTGCARCHDHKFDPLTQNDYYGLQAIFADSDLKEEREGKGGGANDKRPAFIKVVVRETPGVVQVLRRGEVEMPVRQAPPALPAVLPGGGPLSVDKHPRASLAKWLTAPNNPLTARVLVNRVWQWHFGKGLVRTANDFGHQGEAPSHSELLDWLASELVSSGWDLRHLQRLILESATYRQSSLRSQEALKVDPDNRLLAGFPRRRLESEELRDAMLRAAGELNPESFGPPVVPVVEPWALAALRNTNWSPTKDEAQLRRRSLYTVVRRSVKLPFFDAFNSPDNMGSCAGRDCTIVASQALALLNSGDTLAHARALAGRLWREGAGDASKAAGIAWPLVFGRPIEPAEHDSALLFLQAREEQWKKSAPAPTALPTGIAAETPMPPARGAAWVEWCIALLNANEFVYVD